MSMIAGADDCSAQPLVNRKWNIEVSYTKAGTRSFVLDGMNEGFQDWYAPKARSRP